MYLCLVGYFPSLKWLRAMWRMHLLKSIATYTYYIFNCTINVLVLCVDTDVVPVLEVVTGHGG